MEQDVLIKKKKIINFFLEEGILLDNEILERIEDETELQRIYSLLKNKASDGFLFLNNDLKKILEKTQILDLNWKELEKSKVLYEKEGNKKVYEKFINLSNEEKEEPQKTKAHEDGQHTPVSGKAETTKNAVKVLFSYEEDSKKRKIEDFVSYFRARYNSIKNILINRQEMQNTTSINRLLNKREKENVSFIGIISDKQETKNNNLMFLLEDPTGQIKALVNKNKPELFSLAKGTVLDEVIGVVGVATNNIVFVNNIVLPEVPLHKELKKSNEDVNVVFLSDLHVGSNKFLPEQFNKFLDWINLRIGNDKQKEIAKKVKYVFIVGDLVDGVGVYPNQEEELIIKDIYEQYKECAKLLEQIPPHISIIVCPGNHDAMRISEPQPRFSEELAKPLHELPNITIVSNPSLVNIGFNEDFPGFDVLLYHGYSFDYYAANVDYIRAKGGYDRGDLIMKFLLQRRHLAPTHTSTLYIPDTEKDNLVISKIPDFFVTGHIHKSAVSKYRNSTLICGSCWQSKTTFQEKVGHNPEPARVPVVNLKTRETKILKFT